MLTTRPVPISTPKTKSGIILAPEVMGRYQALHFKWLRYVTLRIEDDSREVVVDSVSESREADWKTFVGTLPKDHCRFAIYDFEYESATRGSGSKTIFIAWIPTIASKAERELYMEVQNQLRNSMTGIDEEVFVEESADASFNSVLKNVTDGFLWLTPN